MEAGQWRLTDLGASSASFVSRGGCAAAAACNRRITAPIADAIDASRHRRSRRNAEDRLLHRERTPVRSPGEAGWGGGRLITPEQDGTDDSRWGNLRAPVAGGSHRRWKGNRFSARPDSTGFELGWALRSFSLGIVVGLCLRCGGAGEAVAGGPSLATRISKMAGQSGQRSRVVGHRLGVSVRPSHRLATCCGVRTHTFCHSAPGTLDSWWTSVAVR
jgi:hypothetical protein